MVRLGWNHKDFKKMTLFDVCNSTLDSIETLLCKSILSLRNRYSVLYIIVRYEFNKNLSLPF